MGGGGVRIRHQILWVKTNASGDFCYANEQDCIVSLSADPVRGGVGR